VEKHGTTREGRDNIVIRRTKEAMYMPGN